MKTLQNQRIWCISDADGVPYRARYNGTATRPSPIKWTNDGQLATYAEAVEAMQKYQQDSMADLTRIVCTTFRVPDGVAVVDVDGLADDNGKKVAFNPHLTALSKRTLKPYVEWSPSGYGLHIVCKYDLTRLLELLQCNTPDDLKQRFFTNNTSEHIEVYLGGIDHKLIRFTGRALRDFHPIAETDCTVYLSQILGDYMERPMKNEQRRPATAQQLNSDEVVQRLDAYLQQDARFRTLFNGLWDRIGFNSHSDADYALCVELAKRFGQDVKTIDAIFRRSGLYRPKWERQLNGSTYGQRTITNAIRRVRGGVR